MKTSKGSGSGHMYCVAPVLPCLPQRNTIADLAQERIIVNMCEEKSFIWVYDEEDKGLTVPAELTMEWE